MKQILPARMMGGVVAVVACVFAFMMYMGVNTPWLGMRLAADDDVGLRIVSSQHDAYAGRLLAVMGADGVRVDLRADDLIEEPDYFQDYGALAEFYERQTDLANIMASGAVTLFGVDAQGASWSGVVQALPHRPFWSLPATFWAQMIAAIGGFFIGAWVWVLRPKDSAALFFGLTGVGLCLSAMSAGVYSARELAISGDVFRVLSGVNHFGAMMFGVFLSGMFAIYPKRLCRDAVVWCAAVLVLAWWVANVMWVLPSPVMGAQLCTSSEMLLILIMMGVQWWMARRDPPARAAVQWFALCVFVGAGTFISMVIMPVLIGGMPVLSQGFAFLFFLLIYAGVAFGVVRHKLFDLDEWAFRVLFYAGAVALFLALDALFIFVVHMAPETAIGISLLIAGFLYLPMRSFIWERMLGHRGLQASDMFRAVTDVALAPDEVTKNDRFSQMLHDMFDPLEITDAVAVDAVDVRAGGLELCVPDVGGMGAKILRHPQSGRGIFASRHVRLMDEVLVLMRHVEAQRGAFERGAVAERTRIAQDLHDDVGAQLLSGTQKNTIDDMRESVRAALSDIRVIASGLAGQSLPVAQMVADIRYEAGRRLDGAGIALDWVGDVSASDVLPYTVYKPVVSTLREVISNVIKHSQASLMRVSVIQMDDGLQFDIIDDGVGMQAGVGGNGLRHIHARMEQIGGAISYPPIAKGTHVRVWVTFNSL